MPKYASRPLGAAIRTGRPASRAGRNRTARATCAFVLMPWRLVLDRRGAGAAGGVSGAAASSAAPIPTRRVAARRLHAATFTGRRAPACVALAALAACQGDAPPSAEHHSARRGGWRCRRPGARALQPRRVSSIAPGRACPAAGYRRFDFWLGTWEIEDFSSGSPWTAVTIASPASSAAARCSRTMRGGGFVGRSMNTFDPSTGKWYQQLDGQLLGGAGSRRGPDPRRHAPGG